MGKMTAISTEVDEATLAGLDDLAASKGWSRETCLAEVARRYLTPDADFLAAVQEGIDAIDRGEIVSHEEMEAEFEAMIARHQAR